ncbi:sucrose-6-phosphate hydrolase [Marinilactibacillus sp. Marseille-P9653]|uniref:glycoside hydrolase family 32 protein n=1 Tax=Marinilactibacillus sp. Marseille-P9653 TaxID=2866583 RepID=UPI001CE49A6F|nr:sucrose-6-phosphate hydrolase [Marinilactibacillus sp. Marseille-P9653]
MNHIKETLQKEIKTKQPNLVEKVATDPWRLHFHQQPPTGWLNDPNGVYQKDGLYHLYYQYSPLDPTGGVKYWGHKTSTDLVHFKEEEIFLYPDQSFDRDGVYSGSAFEKDGVTHFFYTGNVKHPGTHDYITSGREHNTVHMISQDGFHIDSREVVIDSSEYPDGFTQHIRDPKILEKDGLFYMVLGGRTNEDKGAILLYASKDLSNWEYKGNLLEKRPDLGYMWECPDFFELNGQDILLMSPQGVEQSGHEFENVYQSGSIIGKTDWDILKFEPTADFVELDRGFDFYAPQTFLDEQGRRILWGWMGLPDIEPDYSNPTIEKGWQHAMTLPRELTIEDGKLKQRPLPEYQVLRKQVQKMSIERTEALEMIKETSDTYEMIVKVEQPTRALKIKLSQDTTLEYNGKVFTLSLGASGFGRSKRTIELSELNSIQLFLDTSSLEIFLNDGEYVLTTRLYPTSQLNSIEFSGDTSVQISKWDLKKA